MKLIFHFSPEQLYKVAEALRKAYDLHSDFMDNSPEAMLEIICDDWIIDRRKENDR